jgi:hypothetical protein
MTIFKKIALFILFFPSFYLMADEVSLKKMIEASYPKYKVENIKKTSYSGLYEIFMGGQIIYTDERFSFLIAEGHIVDPKTKKDLTGERLEDLTELRLRARLELRHAHRGRARGGGGDQRAQLRDLQVAAAGQLRVELGAIRVRQQRAGAIRVARVARVAACVAVCITHFK